MGYVRRTTNLFKLELHIISGLARIIINKYEYHISR